MNNTPKNHKLRLWEHGVRMQQAAHAYASKALRDEWDKYQKISAMEQFQESMETIDRTGKDVGSLLIEAMKGPQETWGKRAKVENTMQEAVLYHIGTGALKSFAFAAPRIIDVPPVALTPQIWKGRLNWSNGQILHESLDFVEGRLISAKRAQALLKESLETILPETTPPTLGRPGIKQDIEAAYRALSEAGAFDLEASVKSQCGKIRTWLVHNKPGQGYGPEKPKYDAIRRHLKPLTSHAKEIPKKL